MSQDMTYQWALPANLNVPPDRLRLRLDFFTETILLHQVDEEGRVTTRMVSAHDIARTITREATFSSGLLPRGSLWWSAGPNGAQVAIYRPPRVWKAALQVEAFQPPRRFALPMPALVFLCNQARPPWVYALKRIPRGLDEPVFQAPLFNVFRNGQSCPGTHAFPENSEEIPESFFTSFFSHAGDMHGRSMRYPHDLRALWEELDGKKTYPMGDLVQIGTIEELMEGRIDATSRIPDEL